MIDQKYMQLALEQASLAYAQDEVPVGAVIIHKDKVIGAGFNRPILSNDPTAHAEIVAIREAAHYLNNYRLLDTTLYVTLEPCAMCIGAMIQARIKRLVFGAYDQKAGAVQTVFNLLDNKTINHRIDYEGGVLADECRKLLQDFFRSKRN